MLNHSNELISNPAVIVSEDHVTKCGSKALRDDALGYGLLASRGPGGAAQSVQYFPSDKQATKEVKELAPLFLQECKKKTEKCGSVGKDVKVRIIEDSEWKSIALKYQEYLDNKDRYLQLILKWAPEEAQEKIIKRYNEKKEKIPDGLTDRINNKKLTTFEKDILTKSLLDRPKSDPVASKASGFYSDADKVIYIKKTEFSIGSLAHEMGHAYSHENWDDYLNGLIVRGVENIEKLNEGLATIVADEVLKKWHDGKPMDTPFPIQGYDFKYTDYANKFLKLVKGKNAYDAIFGGIIELDESKDKSKPSKPPEDYTMFGEKKIPLKFNKKGKFEKAN